MGKLTRTRTPTRPGNKRGRKKMQGRPLKPKDKSYFQEDNLFRKEVISILTAYLLFTEELGLDTGFCSANPSAPPNETEIRIPTAVLKHHRCRFSNLIRMTRLAMDPEPAQEF